MCGKRPGKKLYIATMEPFGADAAERILRHQAMRAGKGFDTVERYTDLDGLELSGRYSVALLEDAGNLAANELFGAAKEPEEVVRAVAEGVLRLNVQVAELVVVSNDVHASGERYAPETQAWIRCLGIINQRLAAAADTVIEVVCGLPLVLKSSEG